jgi:cation transport ATPase
MRSDFIVRSVLLTLPAFGLLSGFAVPLFGLPAWQGWVWAAFTMPVLLALLYEIISSLRRGEVGLDIVAALSMTAALAVGENLAAVVVALMYSGGQYLEAFCRASRAPRDDGDPGASTSYRCQASQWCA